MKQLLVLAIGAVAIVDCNGLNLPSFLRGQKVFSSDDADIESHPTRPFHEELADYFPYPEGYFESWSSVIEESDDQTLPSLAFDTVALGADVEEQFEYMAETVSDTFEEYFQDYVNREEEEEELSDDDIDVEDFPSIPRPKLPDHPKLPDLPKKPKLPDHPKKPHPPPKHRFPGHHPHHPNPHFKHVNDTILEFLANSTHHKILYKIVKNDTKLIDLFNQTGQDGKITLFAPTDRAFHKVLEHLPKNHTHPPKWLIRKLIEYHTVDSFYPAGRVLSHRTIPTLFKAHHGPNLTQRIRIGAGLRGVNINFYAHPVFLDIFTSNGVVHAIDSILLPPPPTYFILQIFPTVYSTFFQALHQSGVAREFFPWHKSSSSWTIFAPSNLAWTRVPLPLLAYLFSPRGHRILTKLVEYHISPNTTFYTDSLWKFPHHPHHPPAEDELENDEFPRRPHWKKEHYNVTLPTLVAKRATIRIDEFKFGPFVKIAINGRPTAVVYDVLGYDGVIQVTNRLVLPPRRKCGHHRPPHHGPGHHSEEMEMEEDCEMVEGPAEDEELTIENLKAIFNEE